MKSITTQQSRPRQPGCRIAARVIQVLILMLSVGLAGCASPGSAQSASLAYSFFDDNSGGAAVVHVDVSTGLILETKSLFDSQECREPLKIRRSDDQRTVVVTNMEERGPHLFLWSASRPSDVTGLELASVADEVRLSGHLALLTLEEDAVTAIDLPSQKVVAVRSMDEILTPPANAPEDLIVDPTGKYCVVSFQKDSNSGKKKGNRLVIFSLPDMNVTTDLQLPRSRADLHIVDNRQQQGPGPEVLHIFSDVDTLTVTLDLYGAVGLLPWSVARSGRVDWAEDWRLVSTSESDKITGQSFPDRATALELSHRPYLLVCNAGAQGGSVLVDVQKRKVVWRRATPPGLEAPIFFRDLGQAFSVCSGKLKQRVGNDVVKLVPPAAKRALYVFDFHSPQAAQTAAVAKIPLDGYTTQIAAISHDPPRLIAAVGSKPGMADTLVIIDPVERRVSDRCPAVGMVGRFER